VDEVLVRRLKDTIVDAEGNSEFAERLPAEALEVAYADAERWVTTCSPSMPLCAPGHLGAMTW